MKILTVQGMHCGACEKLIMMELEEVGLDKFVKNVEVIGEEKKGIFSLKEGSDETQIEQMKGVINSMEGYSVE